jgi:hypothetical protein
MDPSRFYIKNNFTEPIRISCTYCYVTPGIFSAFRMVTVKGTLQILPGETRQLSLDPNERAETIDHVFINAWKGPDQLRLSDEHFTILRSQIFTVERQYNGQTIREVMCSIPDRLSGHGPPQSEFRAVSLDGYVVSRLPENLASVSDFVGTDYGMCDSIRDKGEHLFHEIDFIQNGVHQIG